MDSNKQEFEKLAGKLLDTTGVGCYYEHQRGFDNWLVIYDPLSPEHTPCFFCVRGYVEAVQTVIRLLSFYQVFKSSLFSRAERTMVHLSKDSDAVECVDIKKEEE